MKSLREISGASVHVQFLAVLAVFLSTAIHPTPAKAQVTAVPPYSFSVFATSKKPDYYQPDSIATWKDKVFIGYGNNAKPDGSFGSSTIVEYSLEGKVIKTFKVKGHNDGLRVDPKTNLLWCLQNEDASPYLLIYDPVSGGSAKYTFSKPAHGGGYDDIAFEGDNVFISASNPANNPNTKQAIVRAVLKGSQVVVTPILLGNANAVDVTTGQQIQLNLQDPDSLRFDNAGDLTLDSQADGELIVLHNPGAVDQQVFRIPLTSGGSATQIDDTVYPTTSQGVILVSDRDGETVYAVTAPYFGPDAFSAGPTFVGQLNMSTGVETPVVSGMVSPHGMHFIPTP